MGKRTKSYRCTLIPKRTRMTRKGFVDFCNKKYHKVSKKTDPCKKCELGNKMWEEDSRKRPCNINWFSKEELCDLVKTPKVN